MRKKAEERKVKAIKGTAEFAAISVIETQKKEKSRRQRMLRANIGHCLTA